MKFVALALALLLAVGSHAASLMQADAAAGVPSQLEYIRSTMDTFLQQAQVSAKKAVSQLDEPEYQEYKVTLEKYIDSLFSNVKAVRDSGAPITNQVVEMVSGMTGDFSATVEADVKNLQAQIDSKKEEVKTILNKHFNDYMALLQPVYADYSERYADDLKAFRTKMESTMTDLSSKVTTNVEETKNVIIPIVEAASVKIQERMEQLKTMASPYVVEYKEQLVKSFQKVQNMTPEQKEALKAKITPFLMNIKTNMDSIVEALSAVITPE